jgi:hypothetical protein
LPQLGKLSSVSIAEEAQGVRQHAQQDADHRGLEQDDRLQTDDLGVGLGLCPVKWCKLPDGGRVE